MTSKTTNTVDIFPLCPEVRALLARASHDTERWHRKGTWHIVTEWKRASAKVPYPLLFVSTLRYLDRNLATQIKAVKHREKVFLIINQGLPCEAVAERLAWLDVRDPGRVHLFDASRGRLEALLHRLLVTISASAYDEIGRILQAWWEADTLVVMSPRFDRLHVPCAKLPVLHEAPREDRDKFEIDEEGAYVYWPTLDVHLGWEQFLQAVDENAALKAKQASHTFNRKYGATIREIRAERGLSQSEIAGLTPRQVGRIEHGECRATHSALEKLARAHDMSTSDYMDKLARRLPAFRSLRPWRCADATDRPAVFADSPRNLSATIGWRRGRSTPTLADRAVGQGR